ncbi:FecR domain-containing protein [Bradyrhizobium sp. BWA-3-5]|uniref:FecR family protein n=1 Tax=Bradyrhizobium sp. BWA-3-5 TaxID=3080013 RepID=UPI00293E53E8|nr:FecR domain-containing protein [Bradyrhizobium sp. BWA-3-5]WOH67658.1 FecR domain-containing protein [Bradyrhizobium sp. BWA-3-5]
MSRQLCLALVLLFCGTPVGAGQVFAGPSKLTQLAQAPANPAQPVTPATAAPDATAPAADAQAPEEPIGNVATVTGSASVIRNDTATSLKVKDDIYLNDVVQTGANASLGITFIDNTTFNLKANTRISVDNYVYEDGGKSNAAIFDVAKGTAAFVAASVAKTGDMKITTPTATLGIRGTTGLVEVPEGAAANNPRNVAVKLYPDADGRVGRIEVNDRAGAQLGFLTQGASGFTIRPGAGGARFAAVPLAIPQAVMLRDQGFVRQLHSTQNLGRQVVFQQREFRRANPNFVNPNRPIRQLQPGQPPRQNSLPGQNRSGQPPGQLNRPGQPRQNGLPGQPGQPPLPTVPNRQGQNPVQNQGQQQPGQLNRPGQPQAPSQLNRSDQQQPATPNRQGQQRPGSPGQPGLPPRAGQPSRTDLPPQPSLPPRAGQAQQPSVPAQPAAPLARPGLPNRYGVPGLQRPPTVQVAPALRPGVPPTPRRAAPVPQRGKPPKDQR